MRWVWPNFQAQLLTLNPIPSITKISDRWIAQENSVVKMPSKCAFGNFLGTSFSGHETARLGGGSQIPPSFLFAPNDQCFLFAVNLTNVLFFSGQVHMFVPSLFQKKMTPQFIDLFLQGVVVLPQLLVVFTKQLVFRHKRLMVLFQDFIFISLHSASQHSSFQIAVLQPLTCEFPGKWPEKDFL